MELRDFIAETLTGIVLGVEKAREAVHEKADIAPARELSRGDRFTSAGRAIRDVEFDVAVTTGEDSQTKRGLGIVVASITLGGQSQASSNNSIVSRIRFTIPIAIHSAEDEA